MNSREKKLLVDLQRAARATGRVVMRITIKSDSKSSGKMVCYNLRPREDLFKIMGKPGIIRVEVINEPTGN